MRRAALAAAVALGALAGVVSLRAARLGSRQLAVAPAPATPVDEQAAEHLAAALRQRTISHQDRSALDGVAFAGLRAHLAHSYPRMHATLAPETVNEHSLLYTWKGRDPSLQPILFMAHMDVVPVEREADWTHPPFAGEVAGGYVWGRGALDDKGNLIALCEAVEGLLAAGVVPERTIYFAMGHDEEVGGREGNARIAALLGARGVRLSAVFDEGTPITVGIIDGLAAPVATIALTEKGYVTVELTAHSEGGHSSMPPPETAVGLLAGALERLEAAPFAPRLTLASRLSFAYLGPEMNFSRRLVFANLWLFDGVVARQMARGSNATNAMVRTTLAPTMLTGSAKENVLPIEARGTVNLRILPGETIAGTVERVRHVVDDPRIALTVRQDTLSEPAPISSDASPAFIMLHRTIRRVFPGVLVAPSLMMGASDSRHYLPLADDVYRFSPYFTTREDLKRLHGTDERLGVTNLQQAVRYYGELMRAAGTRELQ
jgi:carboxypeptidase PM20D1